MVHKVGLQASLVKEDRGVGQRLCRRHNNIRRKEVHTMMWWQLSTTFGISPYKTSRTVSSGQC